ncbi:MAG: type I secretion system permease/ATPase [Paracoccaceae bacterium]
MADQISLLNEKYRNLLSIAFGFSIFSNLLKLTGPLFMLQVYDRVLGSRSVETLTALFTLITVLFILFGALEFARSRVIARIGVRLQTAMNIPVFNAVLRAFAKKQNTLGASSALQDLSAIATFFASPVILTFFDALWTPIFFLAIFTFHPLLGWLSVCGGGVLVLAALSNQFLTFRKISLAQQQSNTAATIAGQIEAGSDIIFSQAMGTAMAQRWQNELETGNSNSLRASDINGLFSAFTKSFRLLLQSAMLALGAWLVLQNEITAGAMIAGSILMGAALAPIEQGISQWKIAQKARIGWKNLSDFLRLHPETSSPMDLPAPDANLTAKNITLFSLSGEKPVLQNVSFELNTGEVLGIIGKSGSGKTTLLRVLMGLLAPTQGDVRLGGATLQQYSSDQLGKMVGYMPQNTQLFGGTVAENIAHMSMSPDPKRVAAAAQQAGIHQTIMALPQGYDTQITPHGFQLSGGQKQRISLARTLFHEPLILLLDEPSSSLDALGLQALESTISNMKANGKSVIIVGHRPSALSQCDKLLVLQDGKPTAYGPRDTVLHQTTQNAEDSLRIVRGSTL